jgi:catechol 2,3-dioxygenase-like lactoylglutathione lyase family enzyme
MPRKTTRKAGRPTTGRRQQKPSPAVARAVFKTGGDVIIRTESFKDAVHFYENVLGLPVALRDETMLGFETGSFNLYVEKGPPHGAVFEFFVPDLEAAKQTLVAAGCRITEEDPDLPRCYIRDPFGLMFNLNERGA